MPVSLLDVNVLLALAWPTHLHHSAAQRWFSVNRMTGWATCPLTQLGFARLSMQPAVVKVPILLGDVMALMGQIMTNEFHVFWPMDYGLAGIRDEVRGRIGGHHQLADAMLLELAIRQQGRLITFDRKISALLPDRSEFRHAVFEIPV